MFVYLVVSAFVFMVMTLCYHSIRRMKVSKVDVKNLANKIKEDGKKFYRFTQKDLDRIRQKNKKKG
ncbi:MAG: hypothetical protein ACON5A_02575 [Candidatus Comchoanobacterales bacterium]